MSDYHKFENIIRRLDEIELQMSGYTGALETIEEKLTELLEEAQPDLTKDELEELVEESEKEPTPE